MLALLASCIDNDIPFPIIVAEIVEFEVEGQVGEAQIDVDTRSVNFEVADTVDLSRLRITKFKLSDKTRPPQVGLGSTISCVDSTELMLETYQAYRWVLRSKQQFSPTVRLKGQQGEVKFDGDTIRVYVRNLAKTSIEELRLAAGIPSYSIDLSTISDFAQPIDIDVTTYGRTKHYVLVVSVLTGAIEGPSIVEFELDGQVGAAQINAAKRTVSVELPETADLLHLRLTKLTLSEDDATASVSVGSELACVDSLAITLTDADDEAYLWKLHTKQQFTPVVCLKKQQNYFMAKDTIKVYVTNVAKTAIEELILAPAAGNPSYSPDPASITDFKQPIDIDVTAYGKTKHYVLLVMAMPGMAEGPSIVEFELEGQLGEAQINAAKRTVSVELPETADLLHLRLTKLTLSEADATASVSVGSELACVDSLAITLTDADDEEFQWKLHVKQQFTPVVRLKGQLGGFTISNNIISLFVDDVSTTYIQELILAPAAGNPTYSPNPASITDFTQPVDIDVTVYGKTTRYTLNVGGLAGYPCDNPVISITTGAATPGIITVSIEAAVTACSAVQPYFEYREQGATDWTATLPGHVEAGATAYTATLDGLKPNTTYEYRAVANGVEGHVRTFTTDPDPIISLTTQPATDVAATTATLNGNVVCRDAVQAYFEYREQGLTEWIQTASQTANAVATLGAPLTGLEPSTIYEYRLVVISSIGRRDGEILTFTTDELQVLVTSISTGAADPWAKFAHVSAEAMCTQAAVPLGFEYRQQGAIDWIASNTTMSTTGSNAYTITLTGLQPNSKYEYRAVAEGISGDVSTFTTEDAPTVPNLGFDEWDGTQKNSGRITWRPWSGGNTTTFWNTGNGGLTPGILSGGPGLNSNNTPVEGTDAVSGKAAMLKSVKLGSLASTFGGVGFAAGSIFSGQYATNTSNPPTSVKMGHAYTGRPTQLKGWYKYSPQAINEVNSKFYNGSNVNGQTDKMHIYIYLVYWSNRSNKYVDAYEGIFKYVKQNRMIVNEPPVYEAPPLKNGKKLPAEELVAYGEFLSDQTVSSYTQFTINLEYYSATKRPTHIIICATSSYLGSAFTGGENSTLWVDDFELGFDYVEP